MNIYEVAEKAGVSATTVSRVINKTGLVNEKTEQRILKIIDEMGYRPNVFAKGLSTNSMQTIGILTTNISDLYFSTAIQGIVRFAREKNYDVILSQSSETYDEKVKSLQLLVDKRVDGIILIGSVFQDIQDDAYILDTARTIPIVTLNSQITGKNIYSVFCDDAMGTYAAASHLIRQGKRNLVYIYDVDTFSARNKQAGYLRALQENDLIPICHHCESGVNGGRNAARELLSRNPQPDAFLCSEDILAAGVLRQLHTQEISVPGQVSVVGYNNLLIPQCTDPQLSTIDGKVRLLAEYAFDCIHRVLTTGTGPSTIVIAPEFIPDESTEIEVS